MRRDPKSSYDGFTTISLGVNSGAAPIAIPRNQLAWGTNLTSRSSFITSRPGFVRKDLQFLDENGDVDSTLQSHFETGVFQGAIVFQRLGLIVAMIGGRLFRIDPSFWQVTDVSTSGDLNPNNRYRAWFCEAEDWIIAQDGQSIPWIYDGASTVRSDTIGAGGKAQVPIGKAMVYNQGRLVVTYANGREFVIGDIVGGDSGTAPYGFRDAVLYFTENDVINGGGAFSVGMNAGLITALRPVAQVDTSTGQGPTQVFTTGAIFSLNTPVDRTTWQTVNFPLGTVSNVNNGSLSDRATENVNGDIWFRALDGVRSFIVARRDFTTWVNAPLSYEVSRALDGDDSNLLSYASTVVFDNRLLMTCRPYRNWGHGICHQGLAVLDFQPVTSLSARGASPNWEGVWTGVQVLQVLSGTIKGNERGFIFSLSEDDKIQLWELSKKRASDFDGLEDVPIQWTWETGAFPFADSQGVPFPGREMLSLDGGRLFVDDIQADVIFDAFYRTDQDPCWHSWHSWSVCATQKLCGSGSECVTPGNYRQQYRKPFNLPNPIDPGCDTAVNKTLNWGREFQVRQVITGKCRVKMLELVAHQQQENVTDKCAADEECVAVSCCQVNDYAYAIPTPEIPTPPAPPTPATGACCIDSVCSVTTQALCTAAGGVYLGDGSTCSGSPCATTPPTPADPEWPVPTPYACADRAIFGPIEIRDPATEVDAFLGINPGAADPNVYCNGLSPGSVTAWAAEVWSQFVASGTTYSSARLIWDDIPTTGGGYAGWQVFPDQPGNYNSIILLNTKLVVEYCP